MICHKRNTNQYQPCAQAYPDPQHDLLRPVWTDAAKQAVKKPSPIQRHDRQTIIEALKKSEYRDLREFSAEKQKQKTSYGPCQNAERTSEFPHRQGFYLASGNTNPDLSYFSAKEHHRQNMGEFMYQSGSYSGYDPVQGQHQQQKRSGQAAESISGNHDAIQLKNPKMPLRRFHPPRDFRQRHAMRKPVPTLLNPEKRTGFQPCLPASNEKPIPETAEKTWPSAKAASCRNLFSCVQADTQYGNSSNHLILAYGLCKKYEPKNLPPEDCPKK